VWDFSKYDIVLDLDGGSDSPPLPHPPFDIGNIAHFRCSQRSQMPRICGMLRTGLGKSVTAYRRVRLSANTPTLQLAQFD